jgi:hypothetical protein
MNKSTIVLLQKEPETTRYAPWYKLFKGVQQKETKKEKEPMIIDITISLPKVTPKPKRKVRVFSNFVKVGFDQYSIKIDPFSGNEYVKINGVRYEILRDFFNRGVLVEI